jgi:iron(III) transport system ATP-binding protein
LYYRPASEFVARFVGRVNLVSGTISAVDDSSVSVAALGSTIRARSNAGAGVGDRVKLIVRPEAIELVDEATDARTLSATLVSRTFLGEKTEYRLSRNGEMLHAVRYNAGLVTQHRDGSTVGIRIAEDAVTIVPHST